MKLSIKNTHFIHFEIKEYNSLYIKDLLDELQEDQP